jgi:hypothetical protein
MISIKREKEVSLSKDTKMWGKMGSGTYYRWNKKSRVEDYRCLNLKRMCDLKVIQPSNVSAGKLGWYDKDTGQKCSGVSYVADTMSPGKEYIRLAYTETASGKECDYNIALKTTFPPFGGKRFWFGCPNCGRRTTKLYHGGGIYACRQCYNLCYASQQESTPFRLLTQAQKIQCQLGGKGCIDDEPLPTRPKGMHKKTYDRKIGKMLDYHRRSKMAIGYFM